MSYQWKHPTVKQQIMKRQYADHTWTFWGQEIYLLQPDHIGYFYYIKADVKVRQNIIHHNGTLFYLSISLDHLDLNRADVQRL